MRGPSSVRPQVPCFPATEPFPRVYNCLSPSLNQVCNEGEKRVPSDNRNWQRVGGGVPVTGRGVRAGPEGRACSTSMPEAGPGPPNSPRPRAEAGGDSREHRDGRPHHAVGKAAPVHVHGAAARAAEMLLVRLGRRRRLHFRHPGRGWRRRQQERRTPFRFRHAARAPLRPAPAPAPLAP